LLYPLGLLCPELCYKEYDDGTIVGSLPHSMLTDEKQLKKLCIASIAAHNRVALKDSTLKCAGNERIIELLFSIECNLRLRGKKITLVTGPRGWEELYENGGPQIANDVKMHHNRFVCDETDGFRSVQCLQAMMRDLRASLFHTSTLNELEFPGVKDIRTEIDNLVEAAAMKHFVHDVDNGQNYTYAIRQTSALPIYRAHHKVMDLIYSYLTKSPEQVFGQIEEYWIKEESQLEITPTGANDHSHALYFPPLNVWENEKKYTKKCLNLIRCSKETLINDHDIEDFKRLGLIVEEKEISSLRNSIEEKQRHICNMGPRCSRIDSNGIYHCRKPNHAKMNPNPNTYNFVPIPNSYSLETKIIFERLKLMKRDRDGTFIPIDPNLNPGMWSYPTNGSCVFSPCSPLMAFLLRSTHNLLLCDPSMSRRYLTNYNALVDSGATVSFRADKSGTVEATLDAEPNQKIKGNRLHKKKEEETKKHKKVSAKYTSLPEIFRCMLGRKEILTNATFVSVPTVPLESRNGVVVRAKREIRNIEEVETFVRQGLSGTTVIGTPSPILGRNEKNLPQWRRFTNSQEIEIRDCLYSKCSLDNTKSYCIRPPELLFIDNQTDYIRCFYWVTLNNKKVDNRTLTPTQQEWLSSFIYKSRWIDGAERGVFIRKIGIPYILKKYGGREVVESKKSLLQQHRRKSLRILLHCLHFLLYKSIHFTGCDIENNIRGKAKSVKLSFFVRDDDTDTTLPHAVYHNIRPSVGLKFLYHILYRWGKWDTETELFNGSSWRDFFFNAGFPISQHTDEELARKCIDKILLRYAAEAFGYPTCQVVISKYVAQAQSLLVGALIHNTIPQGEVPPFLYTTLYRSAKEDAVEWINTLKDRALTTILSKMRNFPDLPSKEDFMNATINQPLNWRPTLTQLEGQPHGSFYEQTKTLEFLCDKVDKYIAMEEDFKRHTVLHGPPGCGKTFLALLQLLYLIGCGMFGIVTSIPSRRARECGGIHIAQLLKLGYGNSKGSSTSAYLADDIIRNLFKNPKHLNTLRIMSLLIFEEGGLFSAELINTISSVMGYIRHTSAYFANILTTTTIDIEQLHTIDGHPMMMSPNVIVGYDIIDLKYFVRSRNDIPLQRLLNIMANWSNRSIYEVKEFETIIRNNCNFVLNPNDLTITKNHLRIFSKNEAIKNAEEDYLRRYIENKPDIQVFIRNAIDEESERGAMHIWESAGLRAIAKLNKNTKLKETLKIYNNMKVSMTYNELNVFDQGQLAIVRCSGITQLNINDWHKIKVLIAPIGTTVPPTNYETMSDEDLIGQGWITTTVKKVVSKQFSVNYDRITRRSQYPIIPQNGLTIHKIMGDTCNEAVTRISSDPNSPYYLWEKGAAVVLLSRFENLSNLTIIAPNGPDEAINVLKNALDKTDNFYLYTKKVVKEQGIVFEKESVMKQPTKRHKRIKIDTLFLFPYRACDNVFPHKSMMKYGAMYLILSKSPLCAQYGICVFYIGETVDLRQRMNQHNTRCDNIADPFYRPYVPIIYFTGFSSKGQRKSLEAMWHNRSRKYQQKNRQISGTASIINEVIAMGQGICNEAMNHDAECNIVMHTCFINKT
jgi:hypothetical protein